MPLRALVQGFQQPFHDLRFGKTGGKFYRQFLCEFPQFDDCFLMQRLVIQKQTSSSRI